MRWRIALLEEIANAKHNGSFSKPRLSLEEIWGIDRLANETAVDRHQREE
jgi:hypothetical protein